MIVVRNHLLFYRYDLQPNQIRIVRVLDGRMDYPRLLGLPPTIESD